MSSVPSLWHHNLTSTTLIQWLWICFLSNCWSDGHKIFTIGTPPPVKYFNDNHDVIGHVVQVLSWKKQKMLHLNIFKTVNYAGQVFYEHHLGTKLLNRLRFYINIKTFVHFICSQIKIYINMEYNDSIGLRTCNMYNLFLGGCQKVRVCVRCCNWFRQRIWSQVQR